jgi:hypothetical protein
MSILAFPNPIYQPAMRIISAITNANPALVTTSFNHLYLTGSIVRLDIPLGFGMQQANQKFGPITVVSPTTFTIDIDTTLFDTFSVATTFPNNEQYAQAVPFAEINSLLTSAVQNTLPHLAT